MPHRLTMEAIHLLRRLVEKYRNYKKDLHLVFIDLEKAYDRVPRGVLWSCLRRKRVSLTHLKIIRDMYEGVSTCVRTQFGITERFPSKVGLHQGSALSPFLFAVVIDILTKDIQKDVPWCMLFADDIVLVDETRE